MAKCVVCGTGETAVEATASRSLFLYQCLNKRCRAEYVRDLGIGSAVQDALREEEKLKEAKRRVFVKPPAAPAMD